MGTQGPSLIWSVFDQGGGDRQPRAQLDPTQRAVLWGGGGTGALPREQGLFSDDTAAKGEAARLAAAAMAHEAPAGGSTTRST